MVGGPSYLFSQRGFSDGSAVKNVLAMQQIRVLSLGQEDPLEEEMATHSNILAQENPMDKGAWPATVQGVSRNWT